MTIAMMIGRDTPFPEEESCARAEVITVAGQSSRRKKTLLVTGDLEGEVTLHWLEVPFWLIGQIVYLRKHTWRKTTVLYDVSSKKAVSLQVPCMTCGHPVYLTSEEIEDELEGGETGGLVYCNSCYRPSD